MTTKQATTSVEQPPPEWLVGAIFGAITSDPMFAEAVGVERKVAETAAAAVVAKAGPICVHEWTTGMVDGHAYSGPYRQCRLCGAVQPAKAGPLVDRMLMLGAELDEARNNLYRLLRVVGKPATCKSCSRPIYWVTTRNGKAAPVDQDTGVSHFATCPYAERHRK